MATAMEPSLDLSVSDREEVWAEVAKIIDRYTEDLPQLRVSPDLSLDVRDSLTIDFETPKPWRDVIAWVDHRMRKYQLHTGNPRYFGLFNPAPVPLGIAADTLVAAYNPQLAAWSHSPFANELESFLLKQFATKFGLPEAESDGTFCTGGAEANHTAMLCALTTHFPEFSFSGLRALPGQPIIYVSQFAHHSWIKAAKACGLGSDSVRNVACDDSFRMDLGELTRVLELDRKGGLKPFLICGTAGTTNAGVIDPLPELASVARTSNCWYHVDAAWGGAARFVPEYRDWLSGIEFADSITFDTHKFMSVPMGAGVFLTRHRHVLGGTFRTSTDYMPRDADSLLVTEPYAHSLQWSRRFIGLKVFLPLAVAGWEGLANTVRHQCVLGLQLRKMLLSAGWNCINKTPLPIICCFPGAQNGRDRVTRISKAVLESGKAWISTVDLGGPALRVCITNFRSTENDLVELVELLNGSA